MASRASVPARQHLHPSDLFAIWQGCAKVAKTAGRWVRTQWQDIQDSEALAARVDRLSVQLGPYDVDPFGFDPSYVKRMVPFAAWVYRRYFRCQTQGAHHIPDGPVMVVANHSGQLPYDGAMLTMAAFLAREPPRCLRSMVERFVPNTPFVSPFLARCGHILGTPENGRRLLASGAAVLVFPEGVRGLNKTVKKAYKLQSFGDGFMRLAMNTQTPIVPAVVIGAEEQAPSFGNARRLGRLLGLPGLPLTPAPLFGLLPYPVRYHIYFSQALRFQDASDDEQAVAAGVAQVRQMMQAMIDQGLRNRQGIFS